MLKIKTLNLQRDVTAQLENAYKISYTEEENQIGSASFCLPLNDPKVEKVKQMGFIELTDDKFKELYRVMPIDIEENENTKEVTFSCVHVLSTLTDTAIVGLFEILNRTTREVIEELLKKQNNKDWYLRRCDFARRFSYSFENENGLASLIFSVPKQFDEQYRFEWDTSSYPWALDLIKPSMSVVGEVRQSVNLKGLSIKKDPNLVVNRIFAKGQGEGVNALTFKTINGGKDYVQDDKAIAANGGRLIDYVWVDRRFTDKQSLLASAKSLLQKWKEPIVSWSIDAISLNKALGNDIPEKYKTFKRGDVIRLVTKNYGTLTLRIIKLRRNNIDSEPWNLQLEIGGVRETFGGTLADSEREQEINTNYANGAVNFIPYVFRDDIDPTHPAKLKIFIDDDVRNINTCELTLDTTYYRAHSKAVKGGGATVSTTSAGGSSTQTSTSGGGSTQTSSSGGGSSQTSSSAGQSTSTSTAGGNHKHLVATQRGSSMTNDANMSMFVFGAGSSVNVDDTIGVYMPGAYQTGVKLWTQGASDSHSHSVTTPAHTHNVNVPAHTHTVVVPTHSHNITIPPHTHAITLADHTHEIEYGIFEYSKLPSTITIKVDGNTVPKSAYKGISFERLNIVPYLAKSTDEGLITRGTHNIEISANDLARVEVQAILRVFIQSKIGGEF